MNRKKFYDAIRGEINLTTQNVQGFEKVLDYIEQINYPLQSSAYALATAFWETAQTMHPVVEANWLSEAWRKKNLRYYPWHGRGLIQTTWKENYRNIAIEMGLPEDTFLKNPDLLLEWEYALPAMFTGMETGIYTGKSINDYIDNIDEGEDEDFIEYKNARRVVNGTDKATKIAELAIIFERGLKASGYTLEEPSSPVQSDPKGEVSVPTSKEENLLASLLEALKRILDIILKRRD